MKPKSSLTHLQMSASCPYPEPDQHNPWCLIPFLEDTFDYYATSTLGSSKWFLYFTFLHHKPVYNSHLPHTCYMQHASYFSQFGHTINIRLAVQIIKLLITYFLQSAVTSSLSGPNILLSTKFLNTLTFRFTLNVQENKSYILFNCVVVHPVFCVRRFVSWSNFL